MRRKDKEITDRDELLEVIQSSSVCRLGMSSPEGPYVVPLCFGYKGGRLYFHSASEGKKIDMLRANNNVCVEFDTPGDIITGQSACDWGIKFTSVICFGKARFIENTEDKRTAMDIIMRNYSDGTHQYPDKTIEKTCLIEVEITSMTGKRKL